MEDHKESMEGRIEHLKGIVTRLEYLMTTLMDEARTWGSTSGLMYEPFDSPSTHASREPSSSGWPSSRRFMRASRYRIELRRQLERERSRSGRGSHESEMSRSGWDT